MNHATLARRFLLALLAGFILCTALGLNGSSVVMWSVIFREEETASALIAGRPKAVRTDEWLVWTPSALAQARHDPPWPAENPALGAGRSPQLMSLPVAHYTMLFRPQLWGFFLFDFAHGYAWFWNVKIFGLLAAMFVLVRKLAGGDFWAGILGSAWVFLSGYVQWWFSCPPMLPEMLASWALGIWCVITLFETTRRSVSVAATVGLIFAVVNFALCMYPPFQIPLVWLGLAVLAGWIWQRRVGDKETLHLRAGSAWVAIALIISSAVLVPFILEMLPTLRMVAETSYPGARRATGGALSISELLLGLAGPWLSENSFPVSRVNVCNAANFYPLWLCAVLWLIAGLWSGAAGKTWRLVAPMLCMVLALALFVVCPLPAFVGKLTLLSFSTEERCLLPIGIGGILLSVLTLHAMPARSSAMAPRIAVFILAGGTVLAALLRAARMDPAFFSTGRTVGMALLALLLLGLYLWPHKCAFTAVLIASLAWSSLRVNPVVQGMAPLADSSAVGVIREIQRRDPTARWIAYEGSNLPAFLAACGVNVLSGSKTVPDLAFYRTLDPEQQSLEIYNRYSLGVFQLPATVDGVRFEQINFCGHRVFVHPEHPALRAAGVKYVVFPRALEGWEAVGLELVQALPERRMWIYRVAEK